MHGFLSYKRGYSVLAILLSRKAKTYILVTMSTLDSGQFKDEPESLVKRIGTPLAFLVASAYFLVPQFNKIFNARKDSQAQAAKVLRQSHRLLDVFSQRIEKLQTPDEAYDLQMQIASLKTVVESLLLSREGRKPAEQIERAMKEKMTELGLPGESFHAFRDGSDFQSLQDFAAELEEVGALVGTKFQALENDRSEPEVILGEPES